MILTLPFAVLRTLDSSRAGFDSMKRRAINELGAGRNAKLQLQFRSRYLECQRAVGDLQREVSYADLGYQSTWDVTRAQGGGSGIIVNYTGGDTAGAFAPSSPYSRADANPKVAVYARAFLRQFETVFPGISAEWNGRATLSAPILDPNLLCSYSYWKVGQYTAFGGYEGVPQGSIHFAGEHTLAGFPGFHGRRRFGRGAGSSGSRPRPRR